MLEVKEDINDIIENEKMNAFDINKHKNQAFDMFIGEETLVTIEFDKDLTDVMFDRFGEK
jgi:hypothetical protein